MLLKSALALITLTVSSFASAETLRIGTWNIANLHHVDGVALRDRAVPRDRLDYERLAMIAERLDLDIAVLQEIGSPTALARVFPEDDYHLIISDRFNAGDENRPENERDIFTAFVFSKTKFSNAPSISTFTPLSIEHVSIGRDGSLSIRPTRAAMVAEIDLGEQIVKIMGVHLKSSCHQWSLDPVVDQNPNSGNPFRTRFDCRTLSAQLAVLENWVEQQTAIGIPIVIMGDFNRRLNSADNNGNPTDDFWADLNDGTPTGLSLVKGPLGTDTVCWPSHASRFDEHIDFIVHSEAIQQIANFQTVEKLSMGFENDSRYAGGNRQRLSDHCPVVAEIELIE